MAEGKNRANQNNVLVDVRANPHVNGEIGGGEILDVGDFYSGLAVEKKAGIYFARGVIQGALGNAIVDGQAVVGGVFTLPQANRALFDSGSD